MESLESKLFSKSWKPVGGLLEVPRLINYEDALEILKEVQQQVSVEPVVMLKLAKTDIEALDIEARKFLLDNKCDDLVLNSRPFNKGNYLYASDIMVKFISKFSA